MTKCLWCGKETDSLFCIGGGQTLGLSNTGEHFAKITKSYCYNDFLTILRVSQKNNIPLVDSQLYYLLWAEDVKEWYKTIPFIEDKNKEPKGAEQ